MFKKLLIYPLFILALLVSTLALQGANSASAFSGALQDLPYCDTSMPVGFPNPLDPNATFNYSALDGFDPYLSSWYIGYDVDFDYPVDTDNLYIWYTHKDFSNSRIKLDYNVTTSQSSIGLVAEDYTGSSSSISGAYTYAILVTASSGPHTGEKYFSPVGTSGDTSGGTGWGQRENLSCYEYQSSQQNIEYTTSYSDTHPPLDGEPTEQDYTPKVGYTLFDDKRLQALSIDEENTCIPTSQAGCIEPMYNYELIYNNETIDQVALKRWEIYKFQYLNETIGTYTLKVTYHHPGPPYAPFSDDVNLVPATFEINSIIGFQSGSNGGINTCETVENTQSCGHAPVADFSTCFTDTFPYIDLPQCSQNFTKLVQLLSFNTIKFGNQWELSDGCHTLGTLGDWLNLTNKTVCPQFPEQVRTIVTPFVTLALGLITVRFLGNKEGYM